MGGGRLNGWPSGLGVDSLSVFERSVGFRSEAPPLERDLGPKGRDRHARMYM